MTCEKCDKIRVSNMRDEKLAFLRVGKANVLVCACNEHFNELKQYYLLGRRIEDSVIGVQQKIDLEQGVYRVNPIREVL